MQNLDTFSEKARSNRLCEDSCHAPIQSRDGGLSSLRVRGTFQFRERAWGLEYAFNVDHQPTFARFARRAVDRLVTFESQ